VTSRDAYAIAQALRLDCEIVVYTGQTPESARYPSAVRALRAANKPFGMLGSGVTGRCNPEGSNYKACDCSDGSLPVNFARLVRSSCCGLVGSPGEASIHVCEAAQAFHGVAAGGSWQAVIQGGGHMQFLTAGEQALPRMRAARRVERQHVQ
jgi:hypothetical protein